MYLEMYFEIYLELYWKCIGHVPEHVPRNLHGDVVQMYLEMYLEIYRKLYLEMYLQIYLEMYLDMCFDMYLKLYWISAWTSTCNLHGKMYLDTSKFTYRKCTWEFTSKWTWNCIATTATTRAYDYFYHYGFPNPSNKAVRQTAVHYNDSCKSLDTHVTLVFEMPLDATFLQASCGPVQTD